MVCTIRTKKKKHYTSLRKTVSVLTRYEHVVATLRCVLYVAIFLENYSACYHYFVTTVVSTVETVTCTPEACLILEWFEDSLFLSISCLLALTQPELFVMFARTSKEKGATFFLYRFSRESQISDRYPFSAAQWRQLCLLLLLQWYEQMICVVTLFLRKSQLRTLMFVLLPTTAWRHDERTPSTE